MCQETSNTIKRFKLIINVTIFATLLKNISNGCPDFVLVELLQSHTQLNFLLTNQDQEPYKGIFCPFLALATYMYGLNDLKSQIFRYFTNLYQSLVKIVKPS